MKPVRAEWGPSRASLGVSGVGHALGVRLGPGYLATRIGQVGPSRAE